MFGGAPAPPPVSHHSSYMAAEGRQKFFYKGPPYVNFYSSCAPKARKKFLQGPPLCYFFELQKFEGLHSSYMKFWARPGGLVTKFWRFTNMYVWDKTIFLRIFFDRPKIQKMGGLNMEGLFYWTIQNMKFKLFGWF